MENVFKKSLIFLELLWFDLVLIFQLRRAVVVLGSFLASRFLPIWNSNIKKTRKEISVKMIIHNNDTE